MSAFLKSLFKSKPKGPSKPFFNSPFKTKHIHLAVVGATSSGKSYIISDLIQAFANMGLLQYDLEGYRSIGHYENDVVTSDPTRPRPQTDVYACRQENLYGAEYMSNSGSTKFRIDFLNIPGEIFPTDKKLLEKYFELRDALMKVHFEVVTWSDDYNAELYIEPHGVGNATRQTIADAKANTDAVPATKQARANSYLDWDQIFADLRMTSLKEQPKRKTITGKELLRDMHLYNADSVIRSIGEIVNNLGLSFDKDDWDINDHLTASFYFFNYCATATDIIICDQMYRPSKAPAGTEEINFVGLVKRLIQFYTRQGVKPPRSYVAYRGADYLVKKHEAAWRTILGSPIFAQLSPSARKDALYALYALLVHNHRHNHMGDPNMTVEQFLQLAGLTLPNGFSIGGHKFSASDKAAPFIKALSAVLMDFDPDHGEIIGGGELGKTLKAHEGQETQKLMNYSWHNPGIVPPGHFLAGMMRHVYYTATPISGDFYVFENDPSTSFQLFVHNAHTGQQHYFHNYGDHFCFGVAQLGYDILHQNGLDDDNVRGDFYITIADAQ